MHLCFEHPKVSASATINGNRREVTIRANRNSLPTTSWLNRPSALDDILGNPTTRQLLESPEAKSFASSIPEGKGLIAQSVAEGDVVAHLEVRFIDDSDAVLAVSRWTRKEGFSFQVQKPLSEARWK